MVIVREAGHLVFSFYPLDFLIYLFSSNRLCPIASPLSFLGISCYFARIYLDGRAS